MSTSQHKLTRSTNSGLGSFAATGPISFECLVKSVQAASNPNEKASCVDAYMAQQVSFPVVDDESVIFLYRNAEAGSVWLAGDMNGWNPAMAHQLVRLSGTDLFFLRLRFPSNARLDYRFVVDGQQISDPLNTQCQPDIWGARSELRMPEYRHPLKIERNLPIPRGHVEPLETPRGFPLQGVRMYIPAMYHQLVQCCPVLYVWNGPEYLVLGRFTDVADWLIHSGAVRPFVAVLLPGPESNRLRHPRWEQNYVRILVEDVIPFVETQYSVHQNRICRAVLGASLSAYLAAYIALSQPSLFGTVLAQSGFFTYAEDKVIRDIDSGPLRDIAFHVIIGIFDTMRLKPAGLAGDFLAAARRMRQVLKRRNYCFAYHEYPEGHSWGLWRAHLGEAIQFFNSRVSKARMVSTASEWFNE